MDLLRTVGLHVQWRDFMAMSAVMLLALMTPGAVGDGPLLSPATATDYLVAVGLGAVTLALLQRRFQGASGAPRPGTQGD